jgi:signal transduction histidine kinase
MPLRFKLLLIALSTLVLPWLGWQFVEQTKTLLRQGQEQAVLASAELLAKAIEARSFAPLPSGPVLYVQRARAHVFTDSYGDDWASLRPFAQALGPAGDAQELQVILARDNDGLHLFADVHDAVRADPSDPRAAASDHLALVLVRGGSTRRYLLGSATPGAFDAPALGDGNGLPDHLSGMLQENSSGYCIELHLPHGSEPDHIGIGVYDAAQPSASAPEPRALLAYDTAETHALQALVPEHARVRIVGPDTWVLADAGRLAADTVSATRGGWFGDPVYRRVIAPTFSGSTAFAGDPPRIDTPEVRQALAGVPMTSWRTTDQDGVVVLAAAIPLQTGTGVRSALLLEQASRVLPPLANRALLGLAVATLAALLIAGALLLLFGASLSLRIRRLRDAAERAVRTSGRLDSPLPLTDATDELGDLARSFGRLINEIGAYTDYLRTLATKLSHELNTPLAIVKSSLDNLDHHRLPIAARPYLVRARDGAERLGAIVRAMSESGRVERAIALADAEDFDMRALVAGCAESYRALAEPRELKIELPAALMPLHGAPDLIAQALDKLFDNACSFAPRDGWIVVSLAPRGEGATIRLANAGPPLPAMLQDRLFDSLVSLRERGARGGKTPHLGLGLYVVRLVAELHHGSVRARNLAGGEGVEFILELTGMPRRSLIG